MTRVPFPADDYVLLVGRLAYAVTYLEGGVLFDLPYHADVLPPQLQLDALVGKTTNRIGDIIDAHVDKVTDSAVADWLRAAACHLHRAAELRNPVLHSRPATVDGEQRLVHWRPDKTSTITLDLLRSAIDEIGEASAALDPLRVWP